MKRNEEQAIRESLIGAMNDWLGSDAGIQHNTIAHALPTLGDSTAIYMAEAALNILLAIADAEEIWDDNNEPEET